MAKESESELEVVTCQFVADFVDEVYYNGTDIRHSATNINKPVTLKQLQFTPQHGGVLAIAAKTNDPANAVFCFKCTSNRKDSYWNFEVDANNVEVYGIKVFGIAGECPISYNKSFYASYVDRRHDSL